MRRLLAGGILVVMLATALPTEEAAAGSRSVPAPVSAPSAAKVYPNCKALNARYPHGVGKKGARDHVTRSAKPVTTFKVDNTVYAANRKLDRDRDGIACEKR